MFVANPENVLRINSAGIMCLMWSNGKIFIKSYFIQEDEAIRAL